jgi:hypothetical protein
MSSYDDYVRNKSAEGILENPSTAYGDIGTYLRVAAQVRSTQELIAQLKQASEDSKRTTSRIAYLTFALVVMGLAQSVATAWPYLVWWIKSGFPPLFSK